eukprot:347489-Chlamydomonas_euryale.AAC.2
MHAHTREHARRLRPPQATLHHHPPVSCYMIGLFGRGSDPHANLQPQTSIPSSAGPHALPLLSTPRLAKPPPSFH